MAKKPATKQPYISAAEIVKLIAARHREDVFIDECKTGPSAGASHLRLDAWAMKKSWSEPTTYGYEVKVSKNDFQRDEKWHNYLEYCNRFYFVCPYGLIQPEEIPGTSAGLLWVNPGATMLYQKKKAEHRPVNIPEDLFRYILMWRVKTGPEEVKRDRLQLAREELKYMEETKEFGGNLAYRMRRLFDEKTREVQSENYRLKNENAVWAAVKNQFEAVGLTASSGWQVDRLVEKYREGISGKASPMLESYVRQIKDLSERLVEEIEKTKKKEDTNVQPH